MGRKSREKKERRKLWADNTNINDSGNSGFLFISIIFFVFALLPSVSIIGDLIFWHKIQGAVLKPGLITGLHLEVHDSGRGRNSKTVTVICCYIYNVNGKEYIGSRPSVHSNGDNLGNFQRNLYNRLKKNFDQKTPVTVYVNPDDPSISCLDSRFDPLRIVFQILFPIPFWYISVRSLLEFLKNCLTSL